MGNDQVNGLITALELIASGTLPNGDHVEGATVEFATETLAQLVWNPERRKVTVRTRANYGTEKKVKYTFSLPVNRVIRDALKCYYDENYTVYDRQKDVGYDAINLARCKLIKHLLKHRFPKSRLKTTPK